MHLHLCSARRPLGNARIGGSTMLNTLHARLSKLERSTAPESPFADLTDEELEARLDSLTRQIEQETGVPISDLHRQLGEQLAAGELPDGLDAQFVRQYLAATAEGRAKQ